ncbi:hypothetical protein [Ilumatobacter nonamiensis]|uniref:hypothetical protein n=1 Tax=Ilumatobacter nonamiensis TaxID=467093 RepID=UPI0011D1D7BC|nr:hypothetical protein [Ilumatobacter nonamiensis]
MMINLHDEQPPTVPGTHTSTGIRASSPPARRWAVCGIAAGVLGLAQFALTGGLGVDTEALADNQLVAEQITDAAPWVWLYQVTGVLTAVLVAVFAAGLFRKLSQQAPADSLIPMLSVSGLLLVSSMSLVGSGICTEMFWGLTQDSADLDPDTLAAQLAIFNTMGWVWAGAGLTAGAVAVAGLRHGAVGRGLAIGSAVAASLIGLVNLVPLQYLALLPGALWLIGAGIGFARSER